MIAVANPLQDIKNEIDIKKYSNWLALFVWEMSGQVNTRALK